MFDVGRLLVALAADDWESGPGRGGALGGVLGADRGR